MTPAAQAVLERMLRVPSSLYVREIVRGVREEFSTTQVLDALCELEEAGLVSPSTWRLTDDGQAQAEALAQARAAAA